MSFDLKIVKGDIAIDPSGDVRIVFDNDKIRQDIIKILLTRPNENKFHTYYGSEVGALQIGHFSDEELLELDLQSAAEEAVRKIIALQKSQSRYQVLSPGEIIVDIADISIGRDTNDPRLYNIFISVITQELTTVTENLAIRII